jgi:rare lipoprotein A
MNCRQRACRGPRDASVAGFPAWLSMHARGRRACCALLLFAAQAQVQTQAAELRGRASWYHEGSRVACGGRFHPDGLTAAHRSLPCGTRVRVAAGARSVVVRINDRGPYVSGRLIDLSRGAARALGKLGAGVFAVRLTILPPAHSRRSASAFFQP